MAASPSLRERVAPVADAFDHGDLETLVDLFVFVAYADGVIEDRELAAMHEAFEGIFHTPLSDLVVKTLVGSTIDAISAAGPEAFAEKLGAALKERDKGIDGVRLAFALAASDRAVAGIERERIQWVAEAAGLTGAQIRRIDLESRS